MTSRRSFLKLLGAAFAAPAAAAQVAANILRGTPVRKLRMRWTIMPEEELQVLHGEGTVDLSKEIIESLVKWRDQVVGRRMGESIYREVYPIPKIDIRLESREVRASE